MKEKISIIIPTYLRQKIAIKTLKHLTFQRTDSFEVLIIDQTPSKLKNLENFKTKILNMYIKILASWTTKCKKCWR